MSLTFVAPPHLPEALVEPAAQPLSLPHLEMLLSSATIAQGPALERWLCDVLGVVVDGDPPVGALRLAGEPAASAATQAGDPATGMAALAHDGYWLCADPVATTTGLDSVRIDAIVDDLSVDETKELIHALDEFFRQDGLRFVAPAASRWYVKAALPQQISTTPVDNVVGRSMLRRMPTGVHAATWRARLNETQMLLHAHPVNAARQRRGLAMVSSCWVWGGGSWPRFGPAQVDAVLGAPAWVVAACRANSIAVDDAPVALVALVAPVAPVAPVNNAAVVPAAADDMPIDAGLLEEVLASHTGDRRVVVFVAAPKEPSATAQWHSLDTGLFAKLEHVARREPVTLIVPWTDGTLLIDFGRPEKKNAWQRWLGRREPRPAAVGEALRSWLQ